MHGTLDRLVVESDLLADNPLGDPARRPLYVYRPPGVEPDHPRALPCVYVIQGYTGQLDMWFDPQPVRADRDRGVRRLFAAGSCPDALVVFVDAWTSYGGSQFLNSTSTGRYMDYLCDEVVEFVDERYPTAADRDHRGLAGKSSGGYGAMVVPMCARTSSARSPRTPATRCSRPPTSPSSRTVARTLRDDFEGSFDVFFERSPPPTTSTWTASAPLEVYGYAAAYSPDPARPGKALLPFDVATGRLRGRRVGAVAGQGPGADGARPRRRAALDAPDLPRRRQARRVLPGPRRDRRSARSSTSSGSSTPSSSSTASTAASRTAIRARSASSCSRSDRDADARHHRAHLPDDVGADEARARADGAGRGARRALPRRARRSRTCRARPPRPATT